MKKIVEYIIMLTFTLTIPVMNVEEVSAREKSHVIPSEIVCYDQDGKLITNAEVDAIEVKSSKSYNIGRINERGLFILEDTVLSKIKLETTNDSPEIIFNINTADRNGLYTMDTELFKGNNFSVEVYMEKKDIQSRTYRPIKTESIGEAWTYVYRAPIAKNIKQTITVYDSHKITVDGTVSIIGGTYTSVNGVSESTTMIGSEYGYHNVQGLRKMYKVTEENQIGTHKRVRYMMGKDILQLKSQLDPTNPSMMSYVDAKKYGSNQKRLAKGTSNKVEYDSEKSFGYSFTAKWSAYKVPMTGKVTGTTSKKIKVKYEHAVGKTYDRNYVIYGQDMTIVTDNTR